MADCNDNTNHTITGMNILDLADHIDINLRKTQALAAVFQREQTYGLSTQQLTDLGWTLKDLLDDIAKAFNELAGQVAKPC